MHCRIHLRAHWAQAVNARRLRGAYVCRPRAGQCVFLALAKLWHDLRHIELAQTANVCASQNNRGPEKQYGRWTRGRAVGGVVRATRATARAILGAQRGVHARCTL